MSDAPAHTEKPSVAVTPLRVKIIFPILLLPVSLALVAAPLFFLIALFGGLIAENGPYKEYWVTVSLTFGSLLIAAIVNTKTFAEFWKGYAVNIKNQFRFFSRGPKIPTPERPSLFSWKTLEYLVIGGAVGALLFLMLPWLFYLLIIILGSLG